MRWLGSITNSVNMNLSKLRFASLVAQLVKNPPAMQETLIRSLGREVPLRRNSVSLGKLHSSFLGLLRWL